MLPGFSYLKVFPPQLVSTFLFNNCRQQSHHLKPFNPEYFVLEHSFFPPTQTYFSNTIFAMYKVILAATALLSLSAATPLAERQENPDQIALGRLSYSHGNQFVAWVPSKTTQQEACTTHVDQPLTPQHSNNHHPPSL